MITFEDIQKANERIKTTNIKGKEYAEVNQRIKAFRMVYPDGFIKTYLKSNENGVCVFYAECGYTPEANGEYDVRVILGTGHAYEKEDSSFINKTSYIENCETSAVGRALGMAGFGIDTSVASYEEVGNAIAQQETNELKEKRITKAHRDSLEALAVSKGVSLDEICKHFCVDNIKDLTEAQYGHCLNKLNKTEKRNV